MSIDLLSLKNQLNIQPTPEGVNEFQGFISRTRGITLDTGEATEQLRRWLVLLKLLEINKKKGENMP